MKKQIWVATIATGILVLVSGVVAADSLTVNNTAAMGGTGTNCGGSNCGLDVFHDNTDSAYVQDSTPGDETTYRASFLFNPNGISPGSNLRQPIFYGLDNNPNPGAGVCGAATFQTNYRCFLYLTGGIGQNYSVQCFARGNLCGEAATARLSISDLNPTKVCVEYETGAALSGRVAVAAVSPVTDPCPTSGDPAWAERAITNSLFSGVDFVRLGTPATNGFGAGESGNMYFDEFESFRTLAP